MVKSKENLCKREGENDVEEVERLQTGASPHDIIFLRHERGRGEREKVRVQKQRKWRRGRVRRWEEKRKGKERERKRLEEEDEETRMTETISIARERGVDRAPIIGGE